jgi:hypothetical protein
MQRGDGGYMRVVAGMPDATERLPPSAGRRLKEEERRALVERLRQQGWSYRRISDELNISYAMVSRWLDGPEAVSAPLTPLPLRLSVITESGAAVSRRSAPPPPASALPAVVESPSPLLEHLVAQNRLLLHRVDQLVTAEAAHKQAMDDLELRLVANIEEQHKKLGERLLDSIKSLLRKFSRG